MSDRSTGGAINDVFPGDRVDVLERTCERPYDA